MGTLITEYFLEVFSVSYYFSCFFVYSFFGCGLETLFALVNLGELVHRKTLLLFPLCPVYGLGYEKICR